MDLGLFCKELESSLVRRGIPPESAKRHVATLAKTFTDEDLAEIEGITSGEEIEEIAEGIASILAKNRPAQSRERETAAAVPQEYARPDTVEPAAMSVPLEPVSPRPSDDPPRAAEKQKPAQHAADFFAPPESADKTVRGSAVFWCGLILLSPVWLAALCLIVALFGICYIALIAAIIGFVLALIGIVGVGCGVSLVGIIYGVTQLFSFVAAGVYEIGLGVMIAGLVLLCSVLLYNAAVRFLPWVIRWLTVFFGFVFRKLRELFYVIRRECYKL